MTTIEAPATLRLWIPGRPPTPNARRHWRSIAKDNKTWKQTAHLVGLEAIGPAGWCTPAFARVEAIFVVPDHRERDEDNLIAAQKPILDGLVAAGVIAGDSGRYIRRAYSVSYRRGVAGTEYVIEAVAPAIVEGMGL